MAVLSPDPMDHLPTGLKLFVRNLQSLTPVKLDDTNYPSWSATVRANLLAHRLLSYVDGSEPSPPALILDEKATAPSKDAPPVMKPNPAYESWLIVDAQIRACLLAIVSPTVQTHIHALPTSAAIWNHLEQRYNSLSRTHIFQLKERLHSVTKGTDSMQTYLDTSQNPREFLWKQFTIDRHRIHRSSLVAAAEDPERSTVATERSSASTVSLADCLAAAAVRSIVDLCHSISESETSDEGGSSSSPSIDYFEDDEEMPAEEQLDRYIRNGRPEKNGEADKVQAVDSVDRLDVHGRPSERQNDGLLGDDQTVNRDDDHLIWSFDQRCCCVFKHGCIYHVSIIVVTMASKKGESEDRDFVPRESDDMLLKMPNGLETMHVVEADLGTLHKISDKKGIDNKVIDQQAVEDLDPAIWDISPYSTTKVLTDIPTKPPQIVNDIPNEPPQMPNVVPIEPCQVLTDIPTKQPQILNDIPTEQQQVLNDDPSDGIDVEPQLNVGQLEDIQDEQAQDPDGIDVEEQQTKDIAIDQPKDTARQKRVVKCPDKLYDSNQKGKTSRHTKPYLPCLQILLPKVMDKLEVYKERKMPEMGDDVLGIVNINDCPQQQDAVSCGVFVVKMAEHLIMGMEVDVAGIESFRKKIATEVLLYANRRAEH
ncbi:unnamed protein product [Cuscuta campestris]|uniref:Ubiquitin-like protease family profile domain-containing protein n=1 Tax=Cuscuta campestris TaxID=132261 RepID=A0A484NPV4_9ASTE|nr:unnamed protein product [Cuscuta campestris]